MSTVADLSAGSVMNIAAALMNDVSRSVYTYAIQVPYLKLTMQELQEEFELNNIPVTEAVSAVIQVNAGITEIGYEPTPTIPSTPFLPSNMVEIRQLWERTRGVNPYTPMDKKDFLPHSAEGVTQSSFGIYTFQEQKIKVLPSNQNIDLKIDYVKQIFTDIVDETSGINVLNAKTFLEYRTAALLSEFIESNMSTADKLNGYAGLSLDKVTGISVKGKQSIPTRRRPFRSSYKRR